jgi:DNA polymerase-3 subunit gamma/tau
MAKPFPPSPETETGTSRSDEGYTVLARRYRPQQFTDVVGQEPVVRALVNALQSNRVAHAYLFTGGRGVGKTSTARILAKALNCAKGQTPTPCDQCEICQSIASGEDVDVLEIDGASNNGVDEVRELRQNAQYRPSRSRYKIYIIDEVHMLSKSAFNALLKTLEEPPEHVKFIFATTEVQKIPITILSRCQRFDFAGISTARIVERLRQVVSGERLHADDEALELIARRAAGSMRDAQSLLDQLLAFDSENLTTDKVHRLLGTATDERILELASAVLEHDPKRALEVLREGLEAGLQPGELLDQLIEYWRDLMVVQCAGTEARDLSVPARHREVLARQAKEIQLDTILAGLDVLSTARARLRGSSHGRVLLEMALVRLGRLDNLVSLAELAESLEAPAQGQGSPARERLAPVVQAKEATSSSPVSQVSAAPAETVKKKSNLADGPAPDTPRPLSAESLPQVWQRVLENMGPFRARQLAKAGLPAIFGPNTLVLRFPSDYNSEREHCQQAANMARLEHAIQVVTGQSCKLRIEQVAGEAVSKSKDTEDADGSQSRYRRQRAEVLKEPLLKRAVEVLGAQLIDVDEGFASQSAESSDRPETADAEEGQTDV